MSSITDRKLQYSMGMRARAVDISSTDFDIDSGNRAFTIYVGTGGDIKVDMASAIADDDGPVTFSNVFDGTFMPIIVTKVYKTDTTASNILAIW